MKKLLCLLCCLFVIFIFSLYAQTMGPESINLGERYAPESLMPPVVFPHSMHTMFLDCQICHTETGAIKDWRRGEAFDVRYPAEFHPAFCGYCHDVIPNDNNQNTCIFCHIPSE
jgi:hypothetical protein